ncbi:MAG: ABC transporter ATP-binding protein [Armatimonadetes bacterium]|nr:ABC transporter ATP-binding protein [Armatimonadota bacterium]
MLNGKNLSFSYGGPSVLDGVSVSVSPGEFVGLLGANGSGKSTLIRVLLGVERRGAGDVELGGASMDNLSRREIARRITLVPQDTHLDFAFTVRELVAMGRFPHLGPFQLETAADLEAIARALAVCGVEYCADRPVTQLSGGERQRVLLARAVAQDTPILLLDEPISNQDVAHQLTILDLVRSQVQAGRGALAALHDIALAARYCDRLVVLHQGKVAAEGRPDEVVTEENLARYFQVEALVRRDETLGHLLIWPISPAC